ncbi:MAG: Fe-S cluster assembly protein SufD [Saprospiraceae bacterium]|uniref:Fe-S cluster assembly protein SufD n=1 Tax=Candidatus Opimibacter skivensis TaxID=2982028 RepID=A0A9D7SSY2_9BACT|nr:Fe-S cluster assembly protein SufD [Candidatus Opimibacter skivensis]
MSEQENIVDHLSILFRNAEAGLNGMSGSAMHQFQRKSFEALKSVQFPDKKHEDWRYTSVQKLISPKFKLAEYQPTSTVPSVPGLDSYVIHVINGKVMLASIDPRLAEQGLRIIPLYEAFENSSWKEVFGEFLSSSAPSANRAFELLNFSFNSNGFFLSIPKNTKIDLPIEIRIVHDDPEISFSHPLFFIRCGIGSQVELIERFENNSQPKNHTSEALINSLGYLYLENNAVVRHIKWQELPSTQNLVYKLFVTQQRDSRFETFAFDNGGLLTRNNVEIELEAQHTYTSLQGGFIATGQQSMDHQTRINHKAPHCESHELYKGIIDDQASAAFNGKVLVHKDAQKTNAFQQNDTLVLSKFALMNSKPQLEIFADDVKCSHGATIGQLDEKALFYLMSRGLPAGKAKHMLKKAFIAEVLDRMPNESMRNYISSQMGIGE